MIKRKANKSEPSSILSQDAPEELIARLMNRIRCQFCAGIDDNTWFKVHYNFLKLNVIMWPAREMCSKHGFSLPPARYEAIMISILDDVKKHGQVASATFWPGYLMKCVQSHWQHHWEEYYAEAKSVRELTTQALVALGSLEQREDRSVETLALAHKVLTASRKARKKAVSGEQLSFFETDGDPR